MILNTIEEKPLPVYGDGKNVRDWLFVEDRASAVWLILNKGTTGETYNIGGENEWENIKLVNVLCENMEELIGKEKDYYKKLITSIYRRHFPIWDISKARFRLQKKRPERYSVCRCIRIYPNQNRIS